MTLTPEVRAPVRAVSALYSAALDLQAFTGPVSPERLRTMLERAGADECWLSGRRWEVLRTLWSRAATAAEATEVLARYQP